MAMKLAAPGLQGAYFRISAVEYDRHHQRILVRGRIWGTDEDRRLNAKPLRRVEYELTREALRPLAREDALKEYPQDHKDVAAMVRDEAAKRLRHLQDAEDARAAGAKLKPVKLALSLAEQQKIGATIRDRFVARRAEELVEAQWRSLRAWAEGSIAGAYEALKVLGAAELHKARDC